MWVFDFSIDLSNNKTNYSLVEKAPKNEAYVSSASIITSSYFRESLFEKPLTLATVLYVQRIRKPEKYSRRCRFTFVSRGWRRRRFKARSTCLANISKTKYKLTRRPFVVYTTPRSRGVEKAAARKVKLSLGTITFACTFLSFALYASSRVMFLSHKIFPGREYSIQIRIQRA